MRAGWESLRAGRLEAAEAALAPVLRSQPESPEALHLLAQIAQRRGHSERALGLLSRALAANDADPSIYNTLSVILAALDRPREALGACARALALEPRYADAHANRGSLLLRLKQPGPAAQALREAVGIDPGHVQAHLLIGKSLIDEGQLEAAAEAFGRAIELDPGPAIGYRYRANALLQQGRVEEGIESLRSALERSPDSAELHSILLSQLNYSVSLDAAAVCAEHRRWFERHGARLAESGEAHANDHEPERRLRIGYVSPDFRTHSVAFFFEPLLAAHDRRACEIFCYADIDQPDAVTQRLRASADVWRDTTGLADEGLAARVRADRIDILVDLDGHMGRNRMLVFARKPAPVQVTYLGYPNTTGLPTIDYRLSDALADPPGDSDRWHVEALVRLPEGFLCYRAPDESPEVSELPASITGQVTFGSFNNLRKASPAVIAAWAAVLEQVPRSRLILKYKSFTDPGTRERVHARFAAHGIAAERIELVGWAASHEAHLRMYHFVDIALDTFPYGGTTTTCEALWMGVPVVSLVGQHHASRVGLSLLSGLGLADFATPSVADYVACAVGLARDLDRLRELRTGLRERLSHAPLTDARRFARRLEDAYREMWRRWCAKAT